MSATIRLDELTREEVRELAPHATVVLPTAATEQHGPHLPLRTDHAIGEAIVLRAAEKAASSIPVVVAPALAFGNSGHHLFACAMSLTSSTFLSVLNDLADSLVISGFRRLFFLNSHGGNDECVKLLTRDLVLRHNVAVAACAYWEVGDAAAKKAGVMELGYFPGHSGGFETSIMMAIAPELVRANRLPQHSPDPPPIWRRIDAAGLTVQKAGEWEHIGGYSDAPTKASAEAGHRLLTAISDAVAEAMVAFHQAAF